MIDNIFWHLLQNIQHACSYHRHSSLLSKTQRYDRQHKPMKAQKRIKRVNRKRQSYLHNDIETVTLK